MIAFLINELNVRGGTHKQFLKLLEYAQQEEVEFCIITRELDLSKTYPGFVAFKDRIRLFPCEPSSSLWGKFLRLWRGIKKMKNLLHGVDIVNIHDCGFENYFPAFSGKKVYWQINDLPSFFHVGVASGKKLNIKEKLHRKYLLSWAHVVTEFTVNVSKNAERVKKCFGKEARVFYCGIEPLSIHRNMEDSLERFRNGKINLLSSGVFFPYRNYETQLEVVQRLLSLHLDVHLKIIGSTELDKNYVAKIQNLIQQKNLQPNVTICGQVNENEFNKLHASSDMFLFINVDQSWGLAVFEAMSCGLPVIVSKSVGATEILTDGVNSIFVDPFDSAEIVDKICVLMQDEQAYSKLSNTSKNFWHAYTWDKAYCSKMLNLMIGEKSKYNFK